MGYASYATALGPGGYAHTDTCHQPECDAEIDRGLAYLCGPTPGSPSEVGCGRWFCAGHLYVALSDDVADLIGPGGGLCLPCLNAANDESDEDDAPTPQRPDPETEAS
jgi:hypothetical protein